jgi:hypothetical protein
MLLTLERRAKALAWFVGLELWVFVVFVASGCWLMGAD